MVATAVVVRVWERMHGNFGRRWSDQFGHSPLYEGSQTFSPDGAEWARALRDVTPEMMDQAFANMQNRASPFIPTSGEFRVLCFNLPTVMECRDYLKGWADPNPFTVAVAQELERNGGGWRYKHCTIEQAERMLDRAYMRIRDAVMAGKELPPLATQLPAPEPKPRVYNDVTAQEHIRLMQTILGQASRSKKDPT